MACTAARLPAERDRSAAAPKSLSLLLLEDDLCLDRLCDFLWDLDFFSFLCLLLLLCLLCFSFMSPRQRSCSFRQPGCDANHRLLRNTKCSKLSRKVQVERIAVPYSQGGYRPGLDSIRSLRQACGGKTQSPQTTKPCSHLRIPRNSQSGNQNRP